MLAQKRIREFNCHKAFDSFLSYITAVNNSIKLIKICKDNIFEEYFISQLKV